MGQENVHSQIEEIYLTTPIIRNNSGELVSAKNESGSEDSYVPSGSDNRIPNETL